MRWLFGNVLRAFEFPVLALWAWPVNSALAWFWWRDWLPRMTTQAVKWCQGWAALEGSRVVCCAPFQHNIVYTGYASPAGADNGRCFAASFDLRWNPSLITAARMGLSLTPRPLNCIVADVGAHAQENCCACIIYTIQFPLKQKFIGTRFCSNSKICLWLPGYFYICRVLLREVCILNSFLWCY